MAKISDADRARARRMTTNESGRTISDADRARARARARRMAEQAEIQRILNESGGTISDADRMRVAERYMKRNDGGIAKKTPVF